MSNIESPAPQEQKLIRSNSGQPIYFNPFAHVNHQTFNEMITQLPQNRSGKSDFVNSLLSGGSHEA